MPLELLFLGTGTSAGIPMIGCHCAVCQSSDPRDQRTRPSVLISYRENGAAAFPGGPREAQEAPVAPSFGLRRFLIDASPEMRLQMIRHHIDRVDGVFFTHAHADHLFGLDDLRRFNAVMKTHIDIHAEEHTAQTIRSMFRYIFDSQHNVNQSFIPTLQMVTVRPGEPVDRFGVRWTPLRLLHGRLPVLGFRVDHPVGEGSPGASLAYCTDLSAVPPETFPLLEGLEVLVIDGLRYRHHPTHLTVDQALHLIDRIRPRRAFLTHMAHDILHADLAARLPTGVELSYDGLRVDCTATVGPRGA